MPNKLIFITADEAHYDPNATTDEHGLVQFSINTTSITGTSLTVRVSLEGSYQWCEVVLEERLQPKSDGISKLCLVLGTKNEKVKTNSRSILKKFVKRRQYSVVTKVGVPRVHSRVATWIVQTLWEAAWQSPQMRTTMWPSILTAEYTFKRIENRISKGYLHSPVHNITIHSSQEVEATQISINRWTDKQNVVYMYNGIVFSLKKEGNPVTGYSVDEPWRHYAKWNSQSQKTNSVWLHLHEVSKLLKVIEIESRMVVARGWEEGEMRSWYLMGTVS